MHFIEGEQSQKNYVRSLMSLIRFLETSKLLEFDQYNNSDRVRRAILLAGKAL